MSLTIDCPKCGAVMNHQADKLREPRTREEAEAASLGGVLIEIFACPRCGWIAARERSEAEG